MRDSIMSRVGSAVTSRTRPSAKTPLRRRMVVRCAASARRGGHGGLLVADRRRLVFGCRVHGALPLRRRQTAQGWRRLTKQVMLVCIGLVAQARSRLDSF